jgi:CHAT domain-containing protein/lipopolysaccharide biosynthesis regulator YciM
MFFWMNQYRSAIALVSLMAGLVGLAPGLAVPGVAQVVAQMTEQRKVEGDRLLEQGITLFENRQYDAALHLWQQALKLYKNINDREGEKVTLGNLGSAYNALDNYTKAIEYSKQALAIARETRDRQKEGRSLGNLLIAYFGVNDYNKVIEYSEQRLVIARELKDQVGEERALRYLGNAYFQLENYKKAIQYQEKRLVIVREINDRKGEGQALAILGNAYGKLDNYAKAIEYSEKAFVIAQELKDRPVEDLALGNLGAAYSSLGNYSKAIEFHQQRLAIAQEINNRPSQAEAIGALGSAYREMGNYSKAIEFHEQQLAIAQNLKDQRGQGNALSGLGNAYMAVSSYSKAIEFYEQQLAIAREIKDQRSEGDALGNLGTTYQKLGNYSRAIEYQKRHLEVNQKFKDRRGIGLASNNLGNTYYLLSNYVKAIEYYEQSLSITQEIQDRQGVRAVTVGLANVYRKFGNYDRAVELYEQSLAIARELKTKAGEAAALGGLGTAYYYQGNYSEAIAFNQQYLVIVRELKDRQEEGNALNNLSASLFKSGNLTAAEKTLFDCIAVWESLRQVGVGKNDANKVSIFESQARTYRTLQQVLVAQNKPKTALEVAERGRGRAFVELLAQRLAPDQIGRLSTSLVAPSVAQMQQIASAQNATLVQYSIIYDDVKTQDGILSRESELYTWVIPPTDDISFRKVDLKPLRQQQNISLAQLVDQSREVMGARGRGDIEVALSPERLKQQQEQQTQKLKQLHQILIQPIADLLPKDTNQRVIFVPQNELFLVPFPALLDANNKPLIEKHTILTAPSIQVLELTRQQRDRLASRKSVGGKSLIVGNPIMPKVVTRAGDTPVQLSDLPGAKREALEIAKLFNVQAITGQQATETAIAQQMPNAQLIHFATHGLLDDFKGLGVPGAIALAPSGNGQLNDGLLTSDEILDMKLNAELVVLSACDTGRGRITGDGVIGLSRSLITAGVPSIIVSLWKVPDEATALLMTEFYKNLKQSPDKAQALRQAMLSTKQSYPDPLNWAAFTLIGEAN